MKKLLFTCITISAITLYAPAIEELRTAHNKESNHQADKHLEEKKQLEKHINDVQEMEERQERARRKEGEPLSLGDQHKLNNAKNSITKIARVDIDIVGSDKVKESLKAKHNKERNELKRKQTIEESEFKEANAALQNEFIKGINKRTDTIQKETRNVKQHAEKHDSISTSFDKIENALKNDNLSDATDAIRSIERVSDQQDLTPAEQEKIEEFKDFVEKKQIHNKKGFFGKLLDAINKIIGKSKAHEIVSDIAKIANDPNVDANKLNKLKIELKNEIRINEEKPKEIAELGNKLISETAQAKNSGNRRQIIKSVEEVLQASMPQVKLQENAKGMMFTIS